MSVSSILAFVLLGARAFAGPRDRADEKPTRPSYADLKAELGEAKARIAELEDDIARANVQYRRDQDLIDIWRERALVNVPALQAPPIHAPPPGFGAPTPQIALQQAAQQMQAQVNLHAQQAHLQAQQANLAQYQNYQAAAQNQGLGQAMGLLGAQSLINAELWCNCVPSRSQVWATSDPE